ncbi:MAG: nuclease A inhibitor family protein [Microscillaceae bacterium]|jgi:hypothetical protein|nr:nuclease A inhibitor family protein [Microscillaceae bacterium]
MPTTPQEILEKLTFITQDLLLPSESDEPFTAIIWHDLPPNLDNETVRKALDLSNDTPIASQSLESFLAKFVIIQDWFGDYEIQNAHKFQVLLTELPKLLTQIQVFKIGRIEIEVFILGKFESTWLGLQSRLIQT